VCLFFIASHRESDGESEIPNLEIQNRNEAPIAKEEQQLLLTDNINVRILPTTKCGSRLNGDSLFTLQIHAVHLGADSVLAAYVVNRIDATRVKQNAFRQGRFAAKRRRDMNESNNMREMMMTTMMNQPPNDWLSSAVFPGPQMLRS